MLPTRVMVSVLVAAVTMPALASNDHRGRIDFKPITYCVQDLGTPPDQPTGDRANLTIFGMNYRNQIVGTYATGGLSRAFLWEPDRGFSVLGTLPGHNTAEANAINHAGVVVGTSGDYETGQHNSFIWDRRNGIRLLDASLGGNRDGATDINEWGAIAGSSTIDPSDFVNRAYFRDRDGDVFNLGLLPGGDPSQSSNALAVNNLGLVVGVDGGGGFLRAFLWDKQRGLRPLTEQPAGTSLLPHDINDFGTVVGAMSGATGVTRGFRFTRRDGLQDLGSLGGSELDTVEAYSVNVWGSIVGASQVVGGAGRAFIWTERQGMRELTDLLDASNSLQPILGVAKVINDLGVIAVEGINQSTGRGFLLTPRIHRHSPPCQ